MRVHVSFTPAEQPPATVGIVVDVLRATSTMCQALASGYSRVLCCAEIEDARALAKALDGDLTDSAQAAIRIADSFPSALDGLGASRSAWNLRRHGMEADVDACARESVLDVVPRYVRRVGLAAEVTL